MKVHSAIAKAISGTGLRTLFGLVGTGNMLIIDSYACEVGCSYVGASQESNAVLMAIGLSQVRDVVGAVTVTYGPALTNAITAIVEGVRSHTPIVIIAASVGASKLRHTQFIYMRDFVLPTGAGFCALSDPNGAATGIAAAFRRAALEHRPIVCCVPYDLLLADVEYSAPRLAKLETCTAPVTGESMDDAAGIIATAQRPVIVAGRGAIRPRVRKSVVALADRIDALLATTLRARDLFREHEFNIGICGTLSTPVATDIISGSDCLIAFGASLNKFTTAGGSLLRNKRVVQVSACSGDIGRYFPVDAGVIGDPGLTADLIVKLLDEAEIEASGGRTEEVKRSISEYRPAIHTHGSPKVGTIDLLVALHALSEAIPLERVVVVDGGRFTENAWKLVAVDNPCHYVHAISFTSIGVGLAEAIGAATTMVETPTLLVVGDGGFMASGLAELRTAVRQHLNLVIVVCNDGSYGAEYVQLRDRSMNTDIALTNAPAFAQVADAMGVAAVEVGSAESLRAALNALSARDTHSPFLIDLRLDPDCVPDPTPL